MVRSTNTFWKSTSSQRSSVPVPDKKSSLRFLHPTTCYIGLGEKDQAFAWLNRAYADRSYYLAVYPKTDARLDSIRSDPRFADLLRRLGLPE